MRIHWFASISGLGWLIDAMTLVSLVAIGIRPFAANLFSASVAVTLVFFLSQRTIFFAHRRFLVGKFCAYVLWNVFGIVTASALIAGLGEVFAGWIVQLGGGGYLPGGFREGAKHPAVVAAAKISVTPLTMYANYIALSLIMEGRASWR